MDHEGATPYQSTTLEPTTARVGNGLRSRIRANEKALEIVKTLEQETEEFRLQVIDEIQRLVDPGKVLL